MMGVSAVVLCGALLMAGCEDDGGGSTGPTGPVPDADVVGTWTGMAMNQFNVVAVFGGAPDSTLTLNVTMDTIPPLPVYYGTGTYSVSHDTVYAAQELCIFYLTGAPDTADCANDGAIVNATNTAMTYTYHLTPEMAVPVVLTKQP